MQNKPPNKMQTPAKNQPESPEFEAGRRAERAEILKILEIHETNQKRRLLVVRAAGVTESIRLIKER